jgi:hypothetical protein
MGSVREGRLRRCASAECITLSRASNAMPVTARLMPLRRTIGLF